MYSREQARQMIDGAGGAGKGRMRKHVIEVCGSAFPDLGIDSSPYLRLYAWLNGLSADDMTCYCGKPRKFDATRFTLSKYCSKWCADHSQDKKDRMSSVWAQRTPDEVKAVTSHGLAQMNTDESRKQARATNVKRYGAEHAMQADAVKAKRDKTCMDKYGVANPLSSAIVREKIRETCLELYGEENPMQAQSVKRRRIASVRGKYGVDNVMHIPEVVQKLSLIHI